MSVVCVVCVCVGGVLYCLCVRMKKHIEMLKQKLIKINKKFSKQIILNTESRNRTILFSFPVLNFCFCILFIFFLTGFCFDLLKGTHTILNLRSYPIPQAKRARVPHKSKKECLENLYFLVQKTLRSFMFFFSFCFVLSCFVVSLQYPEMVKK